MGAQAERISQAAESLSEQRSQLQTYQPLSFELQSSGLHAGKVLIEAKELTFGPCATPLSFQVRSGERLQLTGSNGSGKTTLLRILMGQQPPKTGLLSCAAFTAVYLDQNYGLIDDRRTVFEQAQHWNERHLSEHELRSLLIYAQFPKESWKRPCSALSGGEKMKLALCCLSLCQTATDMLILDEPTNNLDLQSLDVLFRTVRDFTGTLVVVSHDEWFTGQIGIHQIMALT